MGPGHVEGDDVDALPDAEDVAGVCGIPVGCLVAQMGLRCEEELEGDIGGARRVGEEAVGLVAFVDAGAERVL